MQRKTVALGAMALLACAHAAMADDWTAAQLRGGVQQLVNKTWQPVARGDIVPDGRIIRTTLSGHATFQRGNETIQLDPNTQIMIADKGGAKPSSSGSAVSPSRRTCVRSSTSPSTRPISRPWSKAPGSPSSPESRARR